ncbi:MAG: hypothetical protein AAF957_03055 [Planctomycetota bacterium]
MSRSHLLRVAWASIALLAPACAPSDASERHESTFTLTAEWSPVARSEDGFHLEVESGLAAALDPGPAARERVYEWSDVAALLPPEDLEFDRPWTPDVGPIVELLKQLHPSATARLHRHCQPRRLLVPSEDGGPPVERVEAPRMDGPLGARGTILAREPHLDLLIRAHVQFRLGGGDVFYTPAQFECRLTVDPVAREVLALHIEVPDRDTNVDINVRERGVAFGRVDIAHVPTIRLRTDAAPPRRDAFALDRARVTLLCAFYPWAVVDWHELPDAFEMMKDEEDDRPLHAIVLYGSLDDESC